MSAVNRIARWLVAAVLVTFASTSFAAPQKQWSVAATPSTFATSSNVKVTLTVTNQTPNGNSNINSLQIALPAGYTFDTTHHPVPVSTAWVGQLNWTQGGVITLSNMSPLKPQGSFTIVAYLNVDTNTVGCSATTWPGAPQTMAWTGSSFSGDTFQLLATPSTGVNPNPALAFGSLPTGSVSAGTSITGTVQATSCGAPASGVIVTATMGGQSSGGTTGMNGQTGFTFSTSGLKGTYTIDASGPSGSGYSQISTSVTVCVNGLAFTVQPTNVQTGSSVGATVQATSCSTGSGVSGASVTAQVFDGSIPPKAVGSSQTLLTDANGNVSFSFTTSSLGTFTIGASDSPNYSSATSAKFKVFAGELNCNPNRPFTFSDPTSKVTDPTQSGYAAGQRGFWNKDGLACAPILYSFTNSILVNNTVHLAWDTSTSQLPAFTYTMTWQTEDVANPTYPANNTDTSTFGWPVPRQVAVAWTSSDGTAAGANWTRALACNGTDLPAPYAQLAQDVTTTPSSGTQDSITVNVPPSVPTYVDTATNTTKSYPTATIPAKVSSTDPFPIVIGTERMSVIGISPAADSTTGQYAAGQYTLTVLRGAGGTTPATHSSSGASNYVMSTPLPIDTNPASPNYNMQVPMCVVTQGWTSAGIDPNTGVPQVNYFTTVYDIGDGFVKGSF